MHLQPKEALLLADIVSGYGVQGRHFLKTLYRRKHSSRAITGWPLTRVALLFALQ